MGIWQKNDIHQFSSTNYPWIYKDIPVAFPAIDLDFRIRIKPDRLLVVTTITKGNEPGADWYNRDSFTGMGVRKFTHRNSNY
jgi:hypothetical protein